MPIVDGQYETRLSTTFATIKEGKEIIKSKLARTRKVRISNIPMNLLDELKPFLEKKDVKIILPKGEKPTAELRGFGELAVTKGKIYKLYKGKEALVGSITFSDQIFGISWAGDKIYEIDVMEYSKCVSCLRKMFDTGWLYSEKVK